MASDVQSDNQAIDRAAVGSGDPHEADFLTLYVCRGPAVYLADWAARTGIARNVVTVIGVLPCVLTFWLFWSGRYWWGILVSAIFILVDTADDGLAPRPGDDPRWGTALDRGVALVHPPLWWWAWEHGLAAYGRPLPPIYTTMVLWAIVGGYVAQRWIEVSFITRFHGLAIHAWRPIDSRFRLIAAGRNVNLLILIACLPFRRPDAGLELAAWWTIVSLFFHAVRLAQASERAARGQPIVSWRS
jgi:hypothetical protein